MTDEVELQKFTVTLMKVAPSPGSGPGFPLKPATSDEAMRDFNVELPATLPGGLKRTIIVQGDTSQPVLIADYSSDSPDANTYLSYILTPASVYEPGPDGKLRYLVLADSIERRIVAGRVVALAKQDTRTPQQPGNLTGVWEKEDNLALVVAYGMDTLGLEAAMRPII
jgi:hypothetical protein